MLEEEQLLAACTAGDASTFTRLATLVDVSFDCNLPLRTAASQGHAEIVYRLLKDPRTDPTACNNSALRASLGNEHLDVIVLLLADRRVRQAIAEDFPMNEYLFKVYRKFMDKQTAWQLTLP